MSAHPNLDRESFQKLLTAAFTVQESGMDTQLLFSLVDVQRSIATATGEPDVDRAMALIAEGVRNVANAAGIAIALVQGDALVYRAGSGSAVPYAGRHVTAVLNVFARNGTRIKTLRVENAQTDARVEAAMCRQAGVKALLILPIIRECAAAGVLEVLFSEAHTFEDREVRTYGLMAGLIEEAIVRDGVQPGQKETQQAQPATFPEVITQVTSKRKSRVAMPNLERNPWIDEVRGAASELPSLGRPGKGATTITLPVKRALLDKIRWKLAAATVVLTVLAVGWTAYHHRTASHVDGLAQPRSNVAGQQPPSLPATPAGSLSADRPTKAYTAERGTKDMKAASSTFKRVRLGQTEVDYIAEDVTIRHFTSIAVPPQVKAENKQVHISEEVNIGEDVTVRHFADKPAIGSQTGPVPVAEHSAESPSPVPK